MRGKKGIALLVALIAVAFGIMVLPQRVTSQSQSAEEQVPAFHAEAPRGPLPETLSPAQFPNVVVQNAYALAARVKKILYQQPCYCHCDRSHGHGSLLDCFASKHGSECGVCIREALYTYEQSRQGKSAAEIRQGMQHGAWQQVDISKYQTPVVAQ